MTRHGGIRFVAFGRQIGARAIRSTASQIGTTIAKGKVAGRATKGTEADPDDTPAAVVIRWRCRQSAHTHDSGNTCHPATKMRPGGIFAKLHGQKFVTKLRPIARVTNQFTQDTWPGKPS
ncbi:hypothetical protein [Streptomyces sp. NPDC102437]|uniref:hypothetical protein n=1 Tax=Streptomyces sp. NPDC102437 TaxID=3366175 RepID=UPI00381A15AC